MQQKPEKPDIAFIAWHSKVVTRLVKTRLQLGFSREQVAYRMSIPVENVIAIELHELRVDLALLHSWSRVLGTTVGDICDVE